MCCGSFATAGRSMKGLKERYLFSLKTTLGDIGRRFVEGGGLKGGGLDGMNNFVETRVNVGGSGDETSPRRIYKLVEIQFMD